MEQFILLATGDVIGELQQLSAKGYLVLLEGREGTDLCQSNNPSNCHTVLNDYQREGLRKILVNSSYISEAWK